MTISNKTRKLLWGKSGNRCAICRIELAIDSTIKSDDCVIGEECHIRSNKDKGPRFTQDYPSDKIDSFQNLLLLCSIHHKMIDDQGETYTIDLLDQIKSNHEKWVKKIFTENQNEIKPLKVKQVKDKIPEYLIKLTSGKDITAIVKGAHALSFDNDKLINQMEVDLIAGVIQELQDYGEIDLEPAEIINFEYYFDEKIVELENIGFYIFGARENRILDGGHGGPKNFSVSIIKIIRKDNSEIIQL